MVEYKWAGTYGKWGIRQLGDVTINSLKNIEAKYKIDCLPFMAEAVKLFSPNTQVGKQFADLTSKIQGAVKLIGRVRGSAGRRAMPGEVETLFSTMKEINKDFQEVQKLVKSEISLKMELASMEEDLGISLEGLAETHKVVEKSLRTIKIKKKVGRVGSLISGGLTGLWRNFLYSMVGYKTAPLVGILGRTVSGMWKQRGELKGEMRGRALGEAITPLMAPPSPTGAPMPSLATMGVPSIAAPTAVGGRMGRREMHNAALPIFYFFNRLAYRAKWTKDLMRAVKQLGDRGGLLGEGKAIVGGGGLGERALDLVGGLAILRWAKGVLGQTKGGGSLASGISKGALTLGTGAISLAASPVALLSLTAALAGYGAYRFIRSSKAVEGDRYPVYSPPHSFFPRSQGEGMSIEDYGEWFEKLKSKPAAPPSGGFLGETMEPISKQLNTVIELMRGALEAKGKGEAEYASTQMRPPFEVGSEYLQRYVGDGFSIS